MRPQHFPLPAGLRIRLSVRSAPAATIAVLVILTAPPALQNLAAQSAPATQPPSPAAPSAHSDDISLAEYRSRLVQLDQLVESCRQATDAAHCQKDAVGPDIQVALPQGARSIHFTWLRDLLEEAAKPIDKVGEKKPANAPVHVLKAPADDPQSQPQTQPQVQTYPQFTAPTLFQRFDAAHRRLQDDIQALDSPTAESLSASTRRQALTAILADKEYQHAIVRRTLWQRIQERLGNWYNGVLDKLNQAGLNSPWIGYGAEILFVLALCIVLVWVFIRLERQGRFSPALIRPGFGSGAASARDWQLWLQDAREAAQQGDWRSAIHFLYWASISRLESTGLWPADRARTPREYLSLLGQESPQRPALLSLTRSFERTWYAGQQAAQADFHQAEQLASQLGIPLTALASPSQGVQ